MTEKWFEKLGKKIHDYAVRKGFYKPPTEMDKAGAKIALVISEAIEVLEALRKNQGPLKVTEEICDIQIRTLDLHAYLTELGWADPDIDEIFWNKMDANEQRPEMHGHKWG